MALVIYMTFRVKRPSYLKPWAEGERSGRGEQQSNRGSGVSRNWLKLIAQHVRGGPASLLIRALQPVSWEERLSGPLQTTTVNSDVKDKAVRCKASRC